MTNYFKMRLLFKTHKHRQEKHILLSVVFCAQSEALISLQVVFPISAKLKAFAALPGPIFLVVFINYGVFFLFKFHKVQ